MKKEITYTSVFVSMIVFFMMCGHVFAQAVDAQSAREHYRLGAIYYEHGLYDQAEQEFQKALRLSDALPARAGTGEQAPPGNVTEAVASDESTAQDAAQEEADDALDGTGLYRIHTGDVLAISVWENDELTREVTVRPDGYISFPLVNDIKVAGLTIPRISELLAEQLQEFIRQPQVTTALRTISGNKVIILGEVARPGMYTLEGRRTVLEAVAQAGGFTKDAVLRSVIVIKGGFKNPQAQRVNMSKAISLAQLSQDIALEAQDIVYVPRTFIANVSYVLNQILDPLSKGVGTYNQYDDIGRRAINLQ